MNYSDIMGVTSGVLQLAVACYALRLSRRFGTERVGWLVFGAFFLLAVVHSLLALDIFRGTLGPAVIADITYVLVSILLLTSIARLENSLKKHRQTTSEQRRNLCEWESQVEAQVVELTRSNEELRKIGTKLQVELAEQKQQREQENQTYQALLTAARQTEKDLQQTVTLLQSEAAELKNAQTAARQSGIADLATSLLESVNALSLLANEQARSRSVRTVRAVKLLHKRPTPVRGPLLAPRRKLPVAITQLVRQLSDGQSELLEKIESLRGKLEHARDCGAIAFDSTPATLPFASPDVAADAPSPAELPQASAEPAPAVAHEEMGAADFQEHLIENVTETGTESAEQAAAPEPVQEPTEQSFDTGEIRT